MQTEYNNSSYYIMSSFFMVYQPLQIYSDMSHTEGKNLQTTKTEELASHIAAVSGFKRRVI
jgi:hypothetical protein